MEFTKIAIDKIAAIDDLGFDVADLHHAEDQLNAAREASLEFSDNLERMRTGASPLDTALANLKEYTRPAREWLGEKHMSLDKLISDNPTKAVAAAGAGSAAGAGLLGGLIGRKMGKKSTKGTIAALAGSKKKLALLAALGIPAAAGAAYLAGRKGNK